MPTIWCAQHATRFPFKSSASRAASNGAGVDPSSEEQQCPAGHRLRLEGVYGYCPTCDLLWDAQQAETPDTCPYCQTPPVGRRLCHRCQRLTYVPTEAEQTTLTCQGCGTPFDHAVAISHTCRVLRTTVTTQRQQCPACHELIHRSHQATPATLIPTADTTAAASDTVSPPPSEVEATIGMEGIVITSPVRVRDLHQQYLSRLIRVHFDYNLRYFIKNERGLFYACGVGEPPSQYHIIPSWSRFGVAGDFVHWFSQIFDCDRPRGGDIWVHAPAVADAEWKLLRKGQLEVNRPPDTPPRQTESDPVSPHPVRNPDEATPEPVTVITVNLRPVAESERAASPSTTDHPNPPEAQPASRPKAPSTARRSGWRLAWMLLAGLVVIVTSGLLTWKVFFGTARPTDKPPTTAPVMKSRPNQPQTTSQTNQEAIRMALEGLALTFSQAKATDYATYYDTVLRPYYARREAPAERAVGDMQLLEKTYAGLAMTHKTFQIQVDAKGAAATVVADRQLTGKHRKTGDHLDSTTRIEYRMVKRDGYWLVSGVREITSPAQSEPKAAPLKPAAHPSR